MEACYSERRLTELIFGIVSLSGKLPVVSWAELF
jgi:hypothetical protein